MANKNPWLNASGYVDATAFYAIRNADRDNRKREYKPKKSAHAKTSTPRKTKKRAPKNNFPRVYICSPFRGDIERNTANAAQYARYALEQGFFPIAPHLYLPVFMDDANAAERETALNFGLRLLRGCQEVWVFGDYISDGMQAEINSARQWRKPIKHFNSNCKKTKNFWA